MAKRRERIQDPDLAKVGVALKRAAKKARQLGFATNTPVYVYRNGEIVDLVAEHRTKLTSKNSPTKKAQSRNTGSPKKTRFIVSR